MSILWIYQQVKRDATIVDIAWASIIGILSVYYSWNGQGDENRRILVATITTIWSIRLAWHLSLRKNVSEDGRYAMLRRSWGINAGRKFFVLFLAQALLAWVFSIPAFLCATNPNTLSEMDIIGLCFWIVALLGESIADLQLNRFKAISNNAGKTCTSGLWKYSRHPNYFFEWLFWFAFIPWAISYGSGWISIFAPVLMLALIFKVTGIPYTELRAIESRGDNYRIYQQTTNRFFPWFPKKV